MGRQTRVNFTMILISVFLVALSTQSVISKAVLVYTEKSEQNSVLSQALMNNDTSQNTRELQFEESEEVANNHSRAKRFVLHGRKWHKSVITYKITSYSKKLTRADVNVTMKKAFRKWAEVIPLVFRYSTANEDINIRFAEGDHKCGIIFDGKGGKLADAYFPRHGDIHFDDAEDWSIDALSAKKPSLPYVALRMIGNSLGLRSSDVTPSIMSNTYPINGIVDPNLYDDDISGVQKLYGQCETSFDAIESWAMNFRTYAFKGNVYWRFNDAKDRTDRNYPQPLSAWRGVPDDIDEMFLWSHNWYPYFFKGDKYYKYNDYTDQVHYIRYISQGWPGVPDNIDAAFSHSDRRSYFFKGSLVYQFDNIADRVSSGYPKPIKTVFPGLPNDLDTAFRWFYNGKSYFFKGLYYYEWNDLSGRAIGPKRIKYGWQNHCFV